MAQRIESPTATIPAGTPKSAPVAIQLPFREGIVDRIDIVVPPGPSGLVGFYVSQSGTQLIPFGSGQFIVADDKYFPWPVEDFPTGSKWSCVGYNTDVYPHTIQFHFLVREFPIITPAYPAPIPLG